MGEINAMNLPDKCPFCGAGVRAVKDGNQRWVEFECFSTIGDVGGEFQHRSPICRHAELNAAKARVAELEARCKRLEKAGDNLDSSIACGCGVDGPCRTCMRALEFWKQAKEAKP